MRKGKEKEDRGIRGEEKEGGIGYVGGGGRAEDMIMGQGKRECGEVSREGNKLV